MILVSLGFIAAFPLAMFTTWVSYALICLVPTILLITVQWGGKHPAFAASRPQPARGALFLLLALALGALVALAHFVTVGRAVSPPTPVLSMNIIASVNVAFWLIIIWGGWPFDALAKRPMVAGFAVLVALYLLNYLLVRLLFWLFDAWDALVFEVTAVGAMFLVLNFELWPFTRSPALTRQPLLGVVWTVTVLGIGAIAFAIGRALLRLDAPVFMVRAPIPFIFGTIIVMNMMQDSLFARFPQPLKGLFSAVSAAVIGSALAWAFGALAPLVSGRVVSGPPGYVFEIWLASALLAVTFPFLIIFAELFQFWPLTTARAAEGKPPRPARPSR